MDELKLVVYGNIAVSAILVALVLLPGYPASYLLEIMIPNMLISILFLFLYFRFGIYSFVRGCLFGYTFMLLAFLYYAVDIIFNQTRDALLGYQFVILFYSAIPIILLGGFIGLLIKVVINYRKNKHRKHK